MPSNVKLLAGASGGEPTDANFKNVTLLLHGDGSNGAQNNTFIDSSTNNFTITRNGNTTQGSFSPYGSNWSNYFDGSGDYLTASSNAAFGVGTGDFTIEAWIFPTGAWTSGGFNCLLQIDGTGIYFGQNNAGFGLRQSGTANIISYGTSPTLNTWTHVAIVRSGTTVTMYYNGTSVATATSSANFGTGGAWIGADAGPSSYYAGYISNLRLLKGTALYTSNFTPSTTPLTAITNTSLLTCAYNRFRDGSTNNFTITRNGDVKVTNFAPFAPSSAYSTSANGGSGYFDGSGDYLSAPSNAALDCGTGDWTIECWTYISTRTNGYPLVFGNNRGSWTTDALALTNSNADSSPNWLDKFVFGWNNGGFISPSAGTSQLLVSNATNDLNTWYHFAVVRNGTSIKMYRNGVEVASATISSGASFNWGYNGALVGGGNWDGAGSYYNGYISNLRLVKGTAVYTAAFTPPSSPVTSITNTSLLLNATNAAIFDNSMKNDLETVGNAQISTSVKKFGTGSMAFDGSGDYLLMPLNTQLQLGSGNFTIEFWLNLVSRDTSGACIFANYNSFTTGALSFFAGHATSSSTKYQIACNGTFPAIQSSANVAYNQWDHFAIVRNGNTLTLYINGTADGTFSMTGISVDGVGSNWIVGAALDALTNYELNGYLDEFRITKGVARYTANFTAPTAPFPNK